MHRQVCDAPGPQPAAYYTKGALAMIEDAHNDRRRADELAHRSGQQLRQAARTLHEGGLTMRDTAVLLNISYQRVHQLLAAPETHDAA